MYGNILREDELITYTSWKCCQFSQTETRWEVWKYGNRLPGSPDFPAVSLLVSYGPVQPSFLQSPLLEAAWHRPGPAVTSLPPICEWATNEETWSAEGSRRHWGGRGLFDVERAVATMRVSDLRPPAHSGAQLNVPGMCPHLVAKHVTESRRGRGGSGEVEQAGLIPPPSSKPKQSVCVFRSQARVFWK